MSSDITDIRRLLTEIKPLLEKEYHQGGPAYQAAASARLRLAAVREELERVARNLHTWQAGTAAPRPGPSETK